MEESEEVSPEDEARAACYGLIAHIFHAPPSSDALKTISTANLITSQMETPLQTAWRNLQQVAAETEPARLREEYDQLFIGVGKPDVMLYGSYYLSGFLMEKPLAKLREDLLKLGLSRRQSVGEPEDHISALSETMRLLVMGQGHFPPAPLETQKDFFHRHLESWYRKLTAALVENKVSEFYRRAGSFIQAFFEVETESFEIA